MLRRYRTPKLSTVLLFGALSAAFVWYYYNVDLPYRQASDPSKIKILNLEYCAVQCAKHTKGKFAKNTEEIASSIHFKPATDGTELVHTTQHVSKEEIRKAQTDNKKYLEIVGRLKPPKGHAWIAYLTSPERDAYLIVGGDVSGKPLLLDDGKPYGRSNLWPGANAAAEEARERAEARARAEATTSAEANASASEDAHAHAKSDSW